MKYARGINIMNDASRLLWFLIGVLIGIQLAKVLATEPLSRERQTVPFPIPATEKQSKAS